MNITKLIKSSKRIEAYHPSPSLDSLATSLGLSVQEILKLDANENMFLDRQFMKETLVEVAYETDPRLYPQREEENLKQRLAKLNDIKPSQIVVSVGGDHAIEILFSLLQRGDLVTAVSPTFSMYPRAALQRDLKYREASLKPDFSLNIEKTLKIANGSSILVICNPNNPTGNQFPRDDVLELVDSFGGLVLVDEAYQEYANYSLVKETAKYQNLVVLRTFSKAYGLAGLRLGYCVTREEFASTLRERFLMPYPVPNIVLKTGFKMLENQALIHKTVEKSKVERKWLIDELNKLKGVEAYPSDTNFILFKTNKPYEDVYMALLRSGIFVRKIGNVLGRENCLRVTVAPRPMLERFLTALEGAIN